MFSGIVGESYLAGDDCATRQGRKRIDYRFEVPRTSFLTLCFFEPRGYSRFALGAAFLRAARFTFLRSWVSVMLFVFAICIFCPIRICGCNRAARNFGSR